MPPARLMFTIEGEVSRKPPTPGRGVCPHRPGRARRSGDRRCRRPARRRCRRRGRTNRRISSRPPAVGPASGRRTVFGRRRHKSSGLILFHGVPVYAGGMVALGISGGTTKGGWPPGRGRKVISTLFESCARESPLDHDRPTVPRHTVAVRDSKNPAGPMLALSPAAWVRFVGRPARGR
ncbi:DUF397 domain-containing protein [Streptomyces sp. NPDC053069]|uniref:DUF397 domain-containing protein n=1 Tax=Streptomyces sp. NPDC053069 TaxID=3365695 RepID=UPI0037D27195